MNNNVVNKDAPIQRDSFMELLGQLASNSSAVVHDEIELAIRGVREQVTAARRGIFIVVIGAGISLAAGLSLCAAAIIWLTSYMNPVMAAFVTGSALAVSGVVIIVIGYKQLQQPILKRNIDARAHSEQEDTA
jgi:hypothetical protein